MVNAIITPADAGNLLALIERATVSGREIDVFVSLRAKLYAIRNGAAPAGVELGTPQIAADAGAPEGP